MFDRAADAALTTVSADLAPDWTDAAAYFETVKSHLRAQVGATAWRSWIEPLSFTKIESGSLDVSAPTRLVRDWVRSHYMDDLLDGWNHAAPQGVRALRLDLSVRKAQPGAAAAGTDAMDGAVVAAFPRTTGASGALVDDEVDPTGLSSPLDPRMTFDAYLVDDANAFAVGAARRVAAGDADVSGTALNPLVIHSRVGLGKTHLLHAIAHESRRLRPGARVVYMSAEKFMYQFVRALRFKDTLSFKMHLRAIDVLMIDDIQFICGKESTQEEFFHTINALIDQGRQVVVTADRSPAAMDGLGPRLQSRLNGGLVVEIAPFARPARRRLLEQKCALMKRAVPEDVLDLLAEKITASTRELEGALSRLIAHAELTGQDAVTRQGAESLLADLLAHGGPRRIGIDDIQKSVAAHYGLRLADMHSPRRARPLARPRQLAMYLCKVLTTHSLPEIGRGFGGRDHTTIIHGIRKIETLLENDNNLQNDLAAIKQALGV